MLDLKTHIVTLKLLTANGVWLNSKCIIEESSYTDDDGEVNETKRNALIEAYMDKSGFFPGVFRTDSHGNVFAIKTN